MPEDRDRMPVYGSHTDLPVEKPKAKVEHYEGPKAEKDHKPKVEHAPGSGAPLEEAAREQRKERERAVAVHHQMGELARAEGHYPGEIHALHTSKGRERYMAQPGVREAVADGLVDPDAVTIQAAPVGKASQYNPNEE